MLKRLLFLTALIAVTGHARVSAQGKVSGRVFDDTTGCPLRGVAISVVGATARTLTDAQGRYHLPGVPEAPFSLQASLTGYQSITNDNVSAADTASRVDFSLVRAMDAATGKARVRYPTMKCVLDRRDSAQTGVGRR